MRTPRLRLTAPVRHRSRGIVTLVGALQLLVLVQVLVFSFSTFGVRSSPGFDTLLDGWLQGSAYVCCALLLVLRPALSPVDRGLWWLMAAGIVSRAAAFVVYLGFVRRLDPQPYPSLADVGWLAMYVFVCLALTGLARSRFPRVTAVLVLDAVIAACAAGAVALVVLPELLRRASPAGTPDAAVVVNAMYPILDVSLLLLVLGVLLTFSWRPPPAVGVFGLGAVMFTVIDVAYLEAVAEGSFRPGTPLSALGVVSVALMAFSAWVPPGSPSVRGTVVPGLAVPALLALGCLALLASAAGAPDRALPGGAVLLAVVGVLASVVRTALSFTNLRLSAAAERRAARQALMERLVEAQDAERARIAADVHDDSIQALAAVDFRLSALKKRLRAVAPEEVGGVETAIESVHEAAVRLRNLLFELETPVLEASVGEALEDAASHLFDDTGTRWTVVQLGTGELSLAVRVSAYRIAREALVNVRKHARARTVSVTIRTTRDGIHVDVLDDGVGIPTEAPPGARRRHSGVVAMRDRAVASGGWWQGGPDPSGGTHISFFLPTDVSRAAEQEHVNDRLTRSGQPPTHDL